MTKRILQKRFFDRREYTLEDDCVKAKVKDFKKEYEVDIEYDRIIGNRHRMVDGSVTTYIIMRISFILMVLTFLFGDLINWINYKHTIIFGIVGLITLIIYFISRKDFVKIKVNGDQFIYFHKNKPSSIEVENFIESMMETRDNYLKRKYLDFDKLMPYEDQKKDLTMLKEYKVLDQQEFEMEEQRLKKLFGNLNQTESQIGFKK